jgi:hypothetical protein
MVRPERFELPTYCSGGNRSIQSELRAHCTNYTFLFDLATSRSLLWILLRTHYAQTLCFVAVDGFHGECGYTNGDVFRSTLRRSRVPPPLTRMRDHGLSGVNVERPLPVLDPQHSLQHNREFVELRGLAGLDPSFGTAHMCDAAGRRLGIDAANVFVNELGLIPCGLDASWLRDESRHGSCLCL